MDQELKLKEYPIIGWMLAFISVGGGGYLIVTNPETRIAGLFMAGGGLLFLFFGYALTVTADKQSGMLTLDYRSIFLHSVREIPLRDIQSVRVDSSTSKGRKRGSRNTTYRVEAILKNNERLRL